MEKYGTAGQATGEVAWRMRNACCIPKSTHTHTHTHYEYVIIIAFSLQQSLHETRLTITLHVQCLSYVTPFCDWTDMIAVLENYR